MLVLVPKIVHGPEELLLQLIVILSPFWSLTVIVHIGNGFTEVVWLLGDSLVIVAILFVMLFTDVLDDDHIASVVL